MKASNPITSSPFLLSTQFTKLLQRLTSNLLKKSSLQRIESTAQKRITPLENLRREECDMFRMKTISLLSKDDVLRNLIPHLLQAPIEVNVDPNQESIVCLSQRFEQREQKFKIEGRFERAGLSKNYSIPISFKMIVTS